MRTSCSLLHRSMVILRTKLRCTPSDRWTPEHCKHIKTWINTPFDGLGEGGITAVHGGGPGWGGGSTVNAFLVWGRGFLDPGELSFCFVDRNVCGHWSAARNSMGAGPGRTVPSSSTDAIIRGKCGGQRLIHFLDVDGWETRQEKQRENRTRTHAPTHPPTHACALPM